MHEEGAVYVCELYELSAIHDTIKQDISGAVLIAVMDQYAMHLAFKEGDKGQRLQNNTVSSYFGQVKAWLLSSYPELRGATERKLNKMGEVVEKYCKKERRAVVCT